MRLHIKDFPSIAADQALLRTVRELKKQGINPRNLGSHDFRQLFDSTEERYFKEELSKLIEGDSLDTVDLLDFESL